MTESTTPKESHRRQEIAKRLRRVGGAAFIIACGTLLAYEAATGDITWNFQKALGIEDGTCQSYRFSDEFDFNDHNALGVPCMTIELEAPDSPDMYYYFDFEDLGKKVEGQTILIVNNTFNTAGEILSGLYRIENAADITSLSVRVDRGTTVELSLILLDASEIGKDEILDTFTKLGIVPEGTELEGRTFGIPM